MVSFEVGDVVHVARLAAKSSGASSFDPVRDGAVRPIAGESIDSALRRFKRSCERANVFGECRRRAGFIPRSARRRNKAIAARIRRARSAK